MANYFEDNKSLAFQLGHPLMRRIVELKEGQYASSDACPYAPKDFEDAIDSYEKVLTVVGEICADTLAPNAEQVDAQGPTVVDGRVHYHPATQANHDALSRAGFYGMSLPRQYGGLNFPMVPYVMAAELVSRADGGFANIWGLQDCAETIHEFASPEQKERYLPMANQGKTFAMGLTELNLSCPNVPGKPQIAYDFETTEKILGDAFAYFSKPLGIKLPPYFDIVHFDQAAAIFNKFPLKFVNCVNSIGNGLYVEDETVIIRPKNGFGGIGGEYIKPTALANVHAFYQRLNPAIQIIGTGGVLTGRDAFEHILCGASMVQVGTTLHKEGMPAFTRITEELKAIMAEKGYETLDDFRGKLKYLD